MRTPSFSLILAHVVAFAFIGVYTLLQAWSDFLSPRVVSREHRLRIAFAIYGGVGLLAVLLLSLTHFSWDLVLIRWEWPVTLLLILGTAVLFGLKGWIARSAGHRLLR